MRRHYIYILAAFMLCMPSFVHAENITYQGINYETRPWDDPNVAPQIGCIGIAKAVSLTEDGKTMKSIDIPGRLYTDPDNPNGDFYYVHEIGCDVFRQDYTLESITLPSGLRKIERSAFFNCSNLTYINLPVGLRSIEETAFAFCNSLSVIKVSCDTPPSFSNLGNMTPFYSIDPDAVFIVPYNHLDVYKEDANWSKLNLVEYGQTFNMKHNGINYCLHDWQNGIAPYAEIEGANTDFTDIVIPESVDCGPTSYTVEKVLANAFQGCSKIESITIPYTIKSIALNAFSDCAKLTKVTIASQSISSATRTTTNSLTKVFPYVKEVIFTDSVKSISKYTFYQSSTLEKIVIGPLVEKIEAEAISSCHNLQEVVINSNSIMKTDYTSSYNIGSMFYTHPQTFTIGEGVESIGVNAFYRTYCQTVNLPSTIKTIGASAFENCERITTINLPDGLETIDKCAFYLCTKLTNMLIPESVKSIGANAFYQCESIRVKKGTGTLLLIWGANYDPFDDATGKRLYRPNLTYDIDRYTQTTIPIWIENYVDGYDYYMDDFKIQSYRLITGLHPGQKISTTFRVKYGDVTYTLPYTKQFSTRDLNPKVVASQKTASSITFKASWSNGDAKVTAYRMTIDKLTTEEQTLKLTGLDPGKSFTAKVTLTVTDDKGKNWYYSGTSTLSTSALEFIKKSAKVVSEGNVIVGATANIDNDETNIGFEWRRTDWTDEFPSNTASSYIYDGEMEGYIRKVYTGALWKFRPYYLADSGTYYYGDWVGFDPTNTSYFEPTIHTYDEITIEGNTALLKGYAMRGSENVVVQGFKYWKSTSHVKGRNEAPARIASIPSTAMTVEAEGVIMSTTLTDLEYGTDYTYVAFIKTDDGETYYGEERNFTIEKRGLKGDVNEDGNVDAQDASLIQQHVAGKIIIEDISIADVDSNGSVDAQDASLIQQYVAGKITW